jgi:hypothetical protein
MARVGREGGLQLVDDRRFFVRQQQLHREPVIIEGCQIWFDPVGDQPFWENPSTTARTAGSMRPNGA